MKKKSLYIAIGIILILIAIFAINLIYGNKLINNLYSSVTGKAIGEPETKVSYIVYNNKDTNDIKVLVTIENTAGIEYIEKADNTKINGNGKQTISLDYAVKLNDTINLTVKPKGATEKNEVIEINQALIDGQFKIEDITENSEHIGINIEPNLENNFGDKFNIFYNTDNTSQNWFRYNTKEQLERFYLEQPSEIATTQKNLFLKMEDSSGNAVYTTKTVYENPTLIVNRLTLNKSAITLNKDKTEQLVATVTPSTISSKNIQWKSSDTSVATVSDTGLVTTLRKAGNTVITASVEGLSATCSVGVQNTVLRNESSWQDRQVNLPEGWTIYVTAWTDEHRSGAITGYKGDNCTGESVLLWNMRRRSWG